MSNTTLLHTLRIELQDAAVWLSRKLSILLEREIICEATADDYDYWALKCTNDRFSLADLCKLLSYVNASKEMVEWTIPSDSDSTHGIDVKLCNALLQDILHTGWEEQLVQDDAVYLIGVSQETLSFPPSFPGILQIGSLRIRVELLWRKDELLEALGKDGNNYSALANLSGRNLDLFGNELYWHYPISDLFNASKALNMLPETFVKEYCDTYIGEDSRVPIVRMRPRGSIKRCPMLKDRRCSIHRAKPAVCALFPLGRAVMLDKDSFHATGVLNSQIQYIINPVSCGDKSETHTVRSWLTDFEIDVQDEYFLKWHSFLSEVSLFIRKVEGKISEELLDTIWTTIYVCMYLDYDTAAEFKPQFEENAEKILDAVRNTTEKLGDAS